MATDLGRTKSPPASKYDAFVASQLSRAEGRIRLLDLTAGLLGLAALGLAYVVVMVLCDSKLMLSPHTRQLSLYGFLAGSTIYLYFAVLRPLRLRVNPYYAARQVEQQLPHAKNSIVNWVDLHEQALAPAIRGALGQRAAKDLSRVDLERAISGRRAAWMGGLAALFVAAFITAFFLLGPSPFLSLLRRAFNPFSSGGVSTRTELKIIKPEGGNAAVTVGRGIGFVVEVSGKMPDPRAADAVKLLYRYDPDEPWLERRLVQEPSREWTTSLSAIEVRNGFWYRITGGDAATEEYRVTVRAAPAITDFLSAYHFRPYVARADEVRHERELKELRGTEVVLRVRTNRTLREGWMEFEGKDGARRVPGEVDPTDPQRFVVRFVLDEDGRYRLHFTSTDGEGYADPAAHAVTAIPDKPPTVELTKPGEDVRLPADALLNLEGKAGDDIGVKSLVLRMRVGGEKLRSQPYRGDDALRLAEGGYPREVEYKDFVELARVQGEDGRPFPLRAGMELEYWLEASDACDYPRANVTESKHFRVLLTEPEKNEQKRKQEKKQADQDKKQHEKQQDQKLQKENQERQQERQEQEARNKEEENRSKEADKGTAGEQGEKKDGEQKNDGQGQDNNGQQGDSKDGQGEKKDGEQKNDGEQKGGLSKEEQKIEDQVRQALDQKGAGEDKKSEGKSDTGEQGEGKAGDNKPEGGDAAADKSEAQGKEAGSKDAKEAGEGKDKGQQQPQAGGGDPAQGDGKGDKQAGPMQGDRSEAKGGDPMKQDGAGEAGEGKSKPDGGKPDAGKPDAGKPNGGKPEAGEGKASSDPQAGQNAGQGKPQPMGQGQDAAAGDSKPTDGQGQQGERQAAGEAKDKSAGNSEAKDDAGRKNDGGRKEEGKAEAKQGGSSNPGEQSAAGDAKPSGGQSEHEGMAKGESKPDAGAQARNATPKDVEDLARALESKDAREREEAKRQLERMKKEAADAEAREKAGEALGKMGEPDGSAGTGASKPGDGSSGKSGSEGKDGDGSSGRVSSGSQDGEKGSGSGGKNGQGGNKGQGAGGNGSSPGAQGSQAGNQAGGGGQRRDGAGDAGGGSGNGAPPPLKPQKPRDHRAGQLQLEDFEKKVDKDVLKKAGVSEEAWKKYLEARRKQLSPREQPKPETPTDPRQAVNLPSMGGRTIQPPTAGQGDAHGPDRGQPPPGYRDPFREFTRQMSKKN